MLRLTSRVSKALLAAGAVALSALAAHAQFAPGNQGAGQSNQRQSRQSEAGKFEYYVLAMSWSPSFCTTSAGGSRANETQCAPRNGKRFSFVLHGLWPQYERGWPQNCSSPDGGFVPRPAATRMLDIMPSEKLVFHEYRKHGTCSGLGIDGYFDLSRKLFNKVQIPAKYADVSDPRMVVNRDEIVSDFMAANPGLNTANFVVKCGGSGNMLEEVRVCFDKAGEFRACGKNENQAKLCSSTRVYVPPVRVGGSAAQAPGTPPAEKKGWFGWPAKPTPVVPPGQRTL